MGVLCDRSKFMSLVTMFDLKEKVRLWYKI